MSSPQLPALTLRLFSCLLAVAGLACDSPVGGAFPADGGGSSLLDSGAGSDAQAPGELDSGLAAADSGTASDAGAADSGLGTDAALGGSDASVDGSTAPGVRYLIYGVVWDHASIDCPEGSQVFDDAQGYYTQIIEGEWSGTYSAAKAALEAEMMTDYPGAVAYNIQSSWFTYGKEASHAVIIGYTKDLSPAWDCRPYIVTIGYGTSYEAALAAAVQNKDDNDAVDATYTELDHVNW